MEHKTFFKTNTLKKKHPTEKTTWSNFSKSVRLSHVCNVLSPDRAYARCVTCNKLFDIKDMDTGHWMKRNKKATKYDRRNCHPQCSNCNSFCKGEEVLHEEYILKTYGQEVVDDLKERAAYAYFKIPKIALNIINEESKEIINKICKEKGINKW